MGVYFSGNQPKYLDICKDDFGLNPDLLEKCIEDVCAVIAVHSYGTPCRIKQIEEICFNHNVLLIEDLAVAQGATIDGINVGRFGDVSIVSFGTGKIIDVGHGGAILTNDYTLVKKLEKLINDLDVLDDTSKNKIEQVSQLHTDLYNTSYGNNLNSFAAQFKTGALGAKEHYYYSYDSSYSNRIINELDDLSQNINDRLTKSTYLSNLLSDIPNILISKIQPGTVPWRVNIFIEKGRDFVLRLLLAKGYKVSSWQPSVDLFFENRKESGVETPISDWLGDRVLNLWVNSESDAEYLYAISEDIKRLVVQINSADNMQ